MEKCVRHSLTPDFFYSLQGQCLSLIQGGQVTIPPLTDQGQVSRLLQLSHWEVWLGLPTEYRYNKELSKDPAHLQASEKEGVVLRNPIDKIYIFISPIIYQAMNSPTKPVLLVWAKRDDQGLRAWVRSIEKDLQRSIDWAKERNKQIIGQHLCFKQRLVERKIE